MDSILPKVQEVFRDVLQMPELVLHESLTAQDVAGWDSFTHVRLLSTLEQAFSVSFNTLEIMSMEKVGDLLQAIRAKVPA